MPLQRPSARPLRAARHGAAREPAAPLASERQREFVERREASHRTLRGASSVPPCGRLPQTPPRRVRRAPKPTRQDPSSRPGPEPDRSRAPRLGLSIRGFPAAAASTTHKQAPNHAHSRVREAPRRRSAAGARLLARGGGGGETTSRPTSSNSGGRPYTSCATSISTPAVKPHTS
eukprot:scaffold1175_cov330-Prasinococcus_capsulatus_cf.AAC.12